MEIKVLGPGCKKCEKTAEVVKEALAEAGVEATVVKITDPMEIAGHGVMGTPGVIVDGTVRSAGKVPKKADVLKWLGK